MFEKINDYLLRKSWEKKFGNNLPPLEHVNARGHMWRFMKFKQDEFDESFGIESVKFGPKGNFGSKMDKLTAEIVADSINNRCTTVHPIHRITSKKKKNPLDNIIERFNILLLVGLTESSKRDTSDTPQNTTGVQFTQYGTDGTAESESQTGIIAAHGSRFDLDTHGQRSTLNQTSKYNDSITDADVTVPVTLKEAALYNASTSGIAHARVQYPDIDLIAGERLTLQINELMKNLTT